ncbi:2,3-bisphosphoglycerate-dependent phosphoglycerate mutase [Frankliniella fusca]|uniref:2,3-bisphosphoglycerate-dependent phosphoglycerate mutase n=1 Tax=Frankliniella fusca TaxID=407009 RepID=A0AAE1L8B9_9NEOP|nr:2,3-bisphosphoglycerate-dependent phosphoglycerate mutase [Frankliniella fusca]
MSLSMPRSFPGRGRGERAAYRLVLQQSLSLIGNDDAVMLGALGHLRLEAASLSALDLSALFVGLGLLAVLSPPAVRAKAKTTTLFRLESLGNCPDYPDLPNGFTDSSVFQAGKTLWGKGTFVFTKNYTKFTKAVARINRCESRNDPHCEPFQNWRFGDETCGLLTMKNMIWTPLFHLTPALSCNPIRAGSYRLDNVTIDIDRLKVINFPEKGFWKVGIEVDADKIQRILCYYFEASFIKVRM